MGLRRQAAARLGSVGSVTRVAALPRSPAGGLSHGRGRLCRTPPVGRLLNIRALRHAPPMRRRSPTRCRRPCSGAVPGPYGSSKRPLGPPSARGGGGGRLSHGPLRRALEARRSRPRSRPGPEALAAYLPRRRFPYCRHGPWPGQARRLPRRNGTRRKPGSGPPPPLAREALF